MGFLTTVTVYNDGAHMIDPSKPENAEHVTELATAVYEACLGVPRRTGRYGYSYAVGNFVNMIEVQDTRHADDHTVYVHMGNCLTELNPWSQRTKDLVKEHPDFAKKLISFMKESLKELTKLQKKVLKQKPIRADKTDVAALRLVAWAPRTSVSRPGNPPESGFGQ